MQGQGLKSVFDFNNLNIMGLVDPIVNYSKIMSYKNDLCNLFINEKIDVFIGIDSPDFNMQIQKAIKENLKNKNSSTSYTLYLGLEKGEAKEYQKIYRPQCIII